MPVVRIELGRFSRMVRGPRRSISTMLPYLGLDIESTNDEFTRVEYSPNRPDFGTDYGIARALRGLLGIEVGLPSYHVKPSRLTITVDQRLSKVRPFIACAVADGLKLDEEDVRQLASLEEDLCNGLGRKRRRVSVNLHDLRRISPPLEYKGQVGSFQFVPFGSDRQRSIKEILDEKPEDNAYTNVLSRFPVFPVLCDSKGKVLSLPPVVRGNSTTISPSAEAILVEVTGTVERAVDDALSIIATTLADMGGAVKSITTDYGDRKRVSPDLAPHEVRFEPEIVRRMTGIDLTMEEIARCLGKSRLGIRGHSAIVPRYRIDVMHPVDIAEEVALGYGFNRMTPEYPASRQAGKFDAFEQFVDKVADLMAGAGSVEIMTFELTDENTQYLNFERPTEKRLEVENPRSSDHSLLRDSLVPNALAALAANQKEQYPQNLFEIGRTFQREHERVVEYLNLATVICHSKASFSEAKSVLEYICKATIGAQVSTRAANHWALAEGRSAIACLNRAEIGVVGEVKPLAISAFGLSLPVSTFEINLTTLWRLMHVHRRSK